jgi:hypothetical protein
VKENVIQRFAALQGGLDKNPETLLDLLLTYILSQPARTDLNRRLEKVFLLGLPGHQTLPGQILFMLHRVTTP